MDTVQRNRTHRHGRLQGNQQEGQVTTRRSGGTEGTRETQGAGSVQNPQADQFNEANLRASSHDLRTRTSAIAGSGPTQTAVPDLLQDWRTNTVDACAHELAKGELMPELHQLFQSIEQSNGIQLSPDDKGAIADQFFDQNRKRLKSLAKVHHADLTKTPRHVEATLSKAVVDYRPYISRKRDPFTPIAMNDPAARAKEKVLWENPRLMVIVDLFAPCPKALVVPKKQVMFPVEADANLLKELAQVAAHVSDAFSKALGTPPAGIWINPPQHLMVKQLHVHVLPQAADFTDTGEPLMRAAQADPKVAAQADAIFKKVETAIEAQLGKPS